MIPENEKVRQEAVDRLNILDTLSESSFDNLTLIASQICQTPIALITLIDHDRQWFKSKYGLDVDEMHRDISFCGHAINEPDQILEVNDAQQDDRFHDNPLVAGDPKIRFYAGVPLKGDDNSALGTLCVVDRKPKRLSDDQRKALRAVAEEVVLKMIQRRDAMLLTLENQEKDEKLREIELKYYDLYQNSPDMMLSLDGDRNIIGFNNTLSLKTGYTGNELKGKNILELYDPSCHDQADLVFKRFLDDGFLKDERLTIQSKSGEKIPIVLSSRAIRDGEGNIIHSNSTWKDISELTRLEHELTSSNIRLEKKLEETENFIQKVTDIAPAIIYVFNLQTMSNEYSNREIGTILGYSEEEILEFGDQLIPVLCHPDDLGRVYEHFEKIGKLDDDQVIRVEYRMKHKTEGYKWLMSEELVFERDRNNRVVKHLGYAIDITELKQVQERLINQNDELRQFTYVATHDLKNPMITLEGHFDYIVSQIKDPSGTVTESIECIREELNNFNATLKGLTEVMLVKEGKNENELVDLKELGADIFSIHQKQIEQLGGTFNVDIKRGITINSSKVYLQSIFNNLISNAIKYRSEKRMPAISVTAVEKPDKLVILIKDNGVGIDLAIHKDRVFKMFTQLHGNSTGIGMGLYMVKSMVEKLGGTIKLKSEEDKGTEFSIEFVRQ